MDLLQSLLENRLFLLAVLVVLMVAATRLATYLWRRRSTQRRIRIVGVGGGGSNAVDALIGARIHGADFIAINTDAQALHRSRAPKKIQIGKAMTDGLGAGGDPLVGEAAAHEAAVEIARAVRGADLVVVTAGLGGGTGSGAAPVVASIAREHGVLTVAVATKPFAFEGPRRHAVADGAAANLRDKVDALLTVPNDRVRDIVPADASLEDAFRTVDEVLRRSVQEILDIIGTPGRINLDFADVRTVIKSGGSAVMGVGRATGENRAIEAARQAMAGTLQEGRMNGATSILLNVSGSHGMTLAELTAAAEEVRAHAHPDANIVFGTRIDRRLGRAMQVTLIATGFGTAAAQPAVAAPAGETPAPTTPTPKPVPAPAAVAAGAPAAPVPHPIQPAHAQKPGDWVPPWRRDRSTMPIGRALGDDLGANLEPPIPAHGAPDLQPAAAKTTASPDAAAPTPERRRRKRGPDGDLPVVVSANAPTPPPTPPDPKTPRFLRRR